LPVLLRQQQPGIFERTRQSLLHYWLCIQVVVICLNICSKLLWNTTFFRILQWFCLISNLSQTQFDSPYHRKDASPAYSALTINLCFGPRYHLMKFGHWVFPHLY
jgi:hypothetical protein